MLIFGFTLIREYVSVIKNVYLVCKHIPWSLGGLSYINIIIAASKDIVQLIILLGKMREILIGKVKIFLLYSSYI